jgi:hypothetical protein
MGKHRDHPLTTGQRVWITALAVVAAVGTVAGIVLLTRGWVVLGMVYLFCAGLLVVLIPVRIDTARKTNRIRREVTRLTGRPAGKDGRWWVPGERDRLDQAAVWRAAIMNPQGLAARAPVVDQDEPQYADLTERIRQRRNANGGD